MTEQDIAIKRDQVAKQYDVVVHLARSLALVHEQVAELIRDGHQDRLLDMIGGRSARIMEMLGDILNGMDAVDDDEDAWTYAVFRAAHAMFPQSAA